MEFPIERRLITPMEGDLGYTSDPPVTKSSGSGTGGRSKTEAVKPASLPQTKEDMVAQEGRDRARVEKAGGDSSTLR